MNKLWIVVLNTYDDIREPIVFASESDAREYAKQASTCFQASVSGVEILDTESAKALIADTEMNNRICAQCGKLFFCERKSQKRCSWCIEEAKTNAS